MKVPRDALGRNDQSDKILSNVLGLDGAESQLFEGGFIQDTPNHLIQGGSWLKIPAIRTKVDAAQHDFFCAGTDQLANFLHHYIRRQAAATATHKGNYAVRAALVAAVLNFQNGASAIARYAILRSSLERRLRKNIAGQNLGGPAREGHGNGIKTKQGQEISGGRERRQGHEISRGRRRIPWRTRELFSSKIAQQFRNFSLM